MRVAALAPHYQIEVSREGNMDDFKIIVELKPDAAVVAADPAAKELAHHVKNIVGVSAKVEVRPVGGVARSEGKAKRVVDKRKI